MGAPISPTSLATVVTPNQLVPAEGPKVMPILLNFTNSTAFQLDLTLQEQQAYISMVQTVYIDASAATAEITLTIPGTGQVIKAKAGTQGYYPVLAPVPTRLEFSEPTATGDLIPVFLINVPIAGVQWST